MGKGSDGGSKTTPKKDETTAIPGTGAMMTQPAFIGDNQNMLAQQLAAGGYGNVPDLMSMLSQTFTPMQILDTRPGAVSTPTTPTTTTSGGRGNGGDAGGGGTKIGKGEKPARGGGGGALRPINAGMFPPVLQNILR